MATKQRLREVLTGSPTIEYLNQMNASGWRLMALEWERGPDFPAADAIEPSAREIEVPYGMQISDDGWHLIENAAEMQVLLTAINRIVDDSPMSSVAEGLNQQGYRMRTGAKWTAAAVFDLLPRMIEAGPQIFRKEEWADRRRRLTRD